MGNKQTHTQLYVVSLSFLVGQEIAARFADKSSPCSYLLLDSVRSNENITYKVPTRKNNFSLCILKKLLKNKQKITHIRCKYISPACNLPSRKKNLISLSLKIKNLSLYNSLPSDISLKKI